MAKYTLDETWELCLQLWEWIAERIKVNPDLDVIGLKSEWLVEHDFDGIQDNCFFCHYTVREGEGHCFRCPGIFVDRDFYCNAYEYDYEDRPIKFYEKLLELDKKRKR